MMKRNKFMFMSKTKLLLLCTSIFLTQNLSAKMTTCQKNNWDKPSIIESTPLDGGECNGKFSLYQMQSKGWFIKDIKIKTAGDVLSYTYTLTDVDPVNIKKYLKNRKIKVEKINLNQTSTVIGNMTAETATINIGNLKIGQSGIINHTYKDGNKLIVSSAFVIESNANSSKIKFLPFLDLKQNALPTSNRKVENGDEFVLNYLYDFSLLIAPNNSSFKFVRNAFKQSTFLHPDMFATFLKIIYQPLPTKEMIQDFALSQNMGTVFIVLESTVYIFDSRTFALLDKKQITNNSIDEEVPFYTRVEDIESSLFTGDYLKWYELASKYFVDDKRSEEEVLYEDLEIKGDKEGTIATRAYTNYYKKLLGVLGD